jgi:hypothetical protein
MREDLNQFAAAHVFGVRIDVGNHPVPTDGLLVLRSTLPFSKTLHDLRLSRPTRVPHRGSLTLETQVASESRSKLGVRAGRSEIRRDVRRRSERSEDASRRPSPSWTRTARPLMDVPGGFAPGDSPQKPSVRSPRSPKTFFADDNYSTSWKNRRQRMDENQSTTPDGLRPPREGSRDHQMTRARPLISSYGTKPHTRESFELSRLSPMAK